MINTLLQYKYLDNLVAVISGIITVIYAFMQIVHTHSKKDVNGISVISIGLAMLANLGMTIHGCFKEDSLVVLVAGITFVLNVYRVFQYYRYKNYSSTKT